MSHLKETLRKSALFGIIVIQIAFFPMRSYAADDTSVADPAASSETQAPEPSTPPTDSSTDTPPVTDTPADPPAPVTGPTDPVGPTQTPGPTQPNGADATTYVYNEKTGLWENNYYTWNPVTHETKAKQATTYSLNPSTGLWDTTEWRYDPPSGKYVPNVVSSTTKKPPTANASNIVDPKLVNSGPSSQNIINGAVHVETDEDIFSKATVSNTVDACSVSGDAGVTQNTNGGSATSGNADTTANILNELNSSWGQGGQKVNTFSADIDGDVVGDLQINPMSVNPISNTGPDSNNNYNQNTDKNLKINSSNSGSIYNKVDICAKTGNASVDSNTNAGDATSGNANAVANIVNLMNSSISAGESFIGTININGSLDGDILLPPEVLEQLYAAAQNSAPLSTVDINQIDNSQLLADFTNNENIDNNVAAKAQTGTATVDNNNSAGNATSGAANTNITLLNLTGRDIVGNTGLLVFVNVLGTWVGMIMDAPQGTNTAMIGSGGPGSTNTTNSTTNTDAEINAVNNGKITNDVSVNSQSGNAGVTQNTNAGSAKTGSATSSVNLLNLINSHMKLSDWFGILFINVFGSWTGSFGVNTAHGNPKSLASVAQGNVPVNGVQVFQFTPGTSKSHIKLEPVTSSSNSSTGTKGILASATLPSSTSNPAHHIVPKKNWTIGAAGSLLTVGFLGAERISTLRDKRRNNKQVKTPAAINSK